jgi:hypothetical protein
MKQGCWDSRNVGTHARIAGICGADKRGLSSGVVPCVGFHCCTCTRRDVPVSPDSRSRSHRRPRPASHSLYTSETQAQRSVGFRKNGLVAASTRAISRTEVASRGHDNMNGIKVWRLRACGSYRHLLMVVPDVPQELRSINLQSLKVSQGTKE